jgi:hypothetical protein
MSTRRQLERLAHRTHGGKGKFDLRNQYVARHVRCPKGALDALRKVQLRGLRRSTGPPPALETNAHGWGTRHGGGGWPPMPCVAEGTVHPISRRRDSGAMPKAGCASCGRMDRGRGLIHPIPLGLGICTISPSNPKVLDAGPESGSLLPLRFAEARLRKSWPDDPGGSKVRERAGGLQGGSELPYSRR